VRGVQQFCKGCFQASSGAAGRVPAEDAPVGDIVEFMKKLGVKEGEGMKPTVHLNQFAQSMPAASPSPAGLVPEARLRAQTSCRRKQQCCCTAAVRLLKAHCAVTQHSKAKVTAESV
jgi:hypothetical protein